MKIVIDIPEKVYNRFCNCYRFPDEVEEAIIAITDGEPLEPSEDAISKQAVGEVLFKYVHDDDSVGKRFAEFLVSQINDLPPVNPQKPICPSAGVDCEDCPAYEKKSEWQHDHEILKAYSDGANEVLDKMRLDIAQEIIPRSSDEYDWEARWQNMGLRIALKVIDKYKAEGSD